jgi:AcrR family transcriptional regulator
MANTVDKPRRRDAAGTRKALLAAARTLIAQHGAEGTSTRDVATTAGVNQALVYRYFGSKEKLFTEAVRGTTSSTGDQVMANTPLAELPGALLSHALDITAAVGDHPSSISALITGANDDTIRTILKEKIDTAFGTELAARLEGPDAVLRAELLAALITGIGFLRGKVNTASLGSVDREKLGAYVDLIAGPLLTGHPAPVTADERDDGTAAPPA